MRFIKKYFPIVILLSIISVIIVVVVSKYYNKEFKAILPNQNESQESDVINNSEITPQPAYGYKTVWITVRDKEKIFLYSNLKEKLTSEEFATKNSCAQLVSGGFYDTEGNHIGLFISEGNILNEDQENNLFNGYLSISKEDLATISEYPVFSPRISLQSGPFLLKNSKALNLSLERDENARRIAVGVNKENLLVFLAVYDQSNIFSGPKLSELPDIIAGLNKDKNLQLTNVINLDGGAHSAFISDLISLSEASIVGSFFCIKP